jgi:hypothetical protein
MKRVLKKSLLLMIICERSLLFGVGLLLSPTLPDDLKPPLDTIILLTDYRLGDMIYYLWLFLEFFPLLGVGGFDYLKDIFAGDLRRNIEEGIKNFAELFNPF